MFSRFSAWILRLWGWKVTGRYPHEIKKMIVAVAPHTSWWDFPVGALVNSGMRLHANYVGKHTLFQWPMGYFFRWLGGIPVDRRQKNNFVAATVEAFNNNDRIHLVIAPEGTRKKVEKFKTGFYHIARLAGVPIVLTKFDWKNKIVDFGEIFYPTNDETADLNYIWNYFKGVEGKIPEFGIL